MRVVLAAVASFLAGALLASADDTVIKGGVITESATVAEMNAASNNAMAAATVASTNAHNTLLPYSGATGSLDMNGKNVQNAANFKVGASGGSLTKASGGSVNDAVTIDALNLVSLSLYGNRGDVELYFSNVVRLVDNVTFEPLLLVSNKTVYATRFYSLTNYMYYADTTNWARLTAGPDAYYITRSSNGVENIKTNSLYP